MNNSSITLSELLSQDTITAQEVFDFVVSALRAQGRKSMDAHGFYCAYRGVNDRKCAAGHLIPDRSYCKSMESCTIDENMLDRSLRPHIKLISNLQSTHDAYDMNEWEERWVILARSYNLVYTPLVIAS